MKHRETLDEIREDMIQNLDCPLKKNATHIVFGEGNPNARVMFVGEAPGRNEDKTGRPFIGAAGKVLSSLIEGIGLKREDVYITSIVKYRPPDNRNPTQEELSRHSPYLVRQIKAIRPKVIVTLGNYSTRFVLSGFSLENMKKVPGTAKLNGKRFSVSLEGREYSVIPTYHPAAVLYRQTLKPELIRAFNTIREYAE